MPHRPRHNGVGRGMTSSANRMVRLGRGRGSGRNTNINRTEPTPSNGMFGLPATFTMDTNIVNDVMVGGNSGPFGDSGLVTGYCLNPGEDDAYPEGGCFTGHFKIVGIDIDPSTGDMEVWPDDDLQEEVKAWYTWTINIDPNGQEMDEFNPYYSSIMTWVVFRAPNCMSGQCVGAWSTFFYDEEGNVVQGVNLGIYTADVQACQSNPDEFCPVDGGQFYLENCKDFSGNPDDVCNDEEGTWLYKKTWDGIIGYMAGGSNTTYLVTLLANNKARFGKANPTSGTIVGGESAFDPIESAGGLTGIWSMDGAGNFQLTRWHPNQIDDDGMVFENELLNSPQGTKFTANLSVGDGVIDFTNGNIVDWNNNNGTFQVGVRDDIYPAQPLESGGFDIQDNQNMSISRYMLSTAGQTMRPQHIDYTLHQDGTYSRSGGSPGTWQVNPQQGIIEITSTYDSNFDSYDVYTTDANSLAEGLDISLNGGSMYDYGIQAGRFRRRDGDIGYWYSLPMNYGHSGYESVILYGISDVYGGNLMSYFPTNPGDTHQVWQCNYHNYFQSFACFEERSDGTVGTWNVIAGNISDDGSIYGPAYTDGAWTRGYWETSNVEGSIDGTHGFSGTATWTHQYFDFNLFNDAFHPWENEYYLIPPATPGYEPITWTQTSPIAGDVIAGDVNMDGIVNIQDVVEIISVVLGGMLDQQTQQWITAADVNGDGIINVSDIVIIINNILNNTSLSNDQTRTLRRFRSCVQSGSDLEHCSSTILSGRGRARNVRKPLMRRGAVGNTTQRMSTNRRNISRRMQSNNYQRGGTSSRRTRTSQADYRNSTGKISNPRGGKNY